MISCQVDRNLYYSELNLSEWTLFIYFLSGGKGVSLRKASRKRKAMSKEFPVTKSWNNTVHENSQTQDEVGSTAGHSTTASKGDDSSAILDQMKSMMENMKAMCIVFQKEQVLDDIETERQPGTSLSGNTVKRKCVSNQVDGGGESSVLDSDNIDFGTHFQLLLLLIILLVKLHIHLLHEYEVISSPMTAGVSLCKTVSPDLKLKIVSNKYVELSFLIDPKQLEIAVAVLYFCYGTDRQYPDIGFTEVFIVACPI